MFRNCPFAWTPTPPLNVSKASSMTTAISIKCPFPTRTVTNSEIWPVASIPNLWNTVPPVPFYRSTTRCNEGRQTKFLIIRTRESWNFWDLPKCPCIPEIKNRSEQKYQRILKKSIMPNLNRKAHLNSLKTMYVDCPTGFNSKKKT